jgi:hypothetical protein
MMTSIYPIIVLAELPKIQLENNIQIIAGGIGLDESIAIRKESKKWPILFEFSQSNGSKAEWISDVAIVVRDNKNKLIIAMNVEGPLILLKLDPGKYYLEATFEGSKNIRLFEIEDIKHKKISIYWK